MYKDTNTLVSYCHWMAFVLRDSSYSSSSSREREREREMGGGRERGCVCVCVCVRVHLSARTARVLILCNGTNDMFYVPRNASSSSRFGFHAKGAASSAGRKAAPDVSIITLPPQPTIMSANVA